MIESAAKNHFQGIMDRTMNMSRKFKDLLSWKLGFFTVLCHHLCKIKEVFSTIFGRFFWRKIIPCYSSQLFTAVSFEKLTLDYLNCHYILMVYRFSKKVIFEKFEIFRKFSFATQPTKMSETFRIYSSRT